MKIENLKELQKVIALCKKQGVTDITIDGISMKLSLSTLKRTSAPTLDFSNDFPEASIAVPKYSPISQPQEVIATDELTPEQLMFYSAVAEPGAQDAQ